MSKSIGCKLPRAGCLDTRINPTPVMIIIEMRMKILNPYNGFCSSPETVREQKNSIVPGEIAKRAMKGGEGGMNGYGCCPLNNADAHEK